MHPLHRRPEAELYTGCAENRNSHRQRIRDIAERCATGVRTCCCCVDSFWQGHLLTTWTLEKVRKLVSLLNLTKLNVLKFLY